MKSIIVYGCFLLMLSQVLVAQNGGINTYEFLNLPASARISSLGGNQIAVRDNDANLGQANPALLNSTMHNHLSFNHSFLFEGIQFGLVNYAHHLNNIDATLYGGVQYVNYGDFDQTDEFGNIIGQTGASEYAFTAAVGKTVYDRLSLGGSIKVVSSNLAEYASLGLVSDIAATYFDTASNFTGSVVFRNLGFQITEFSEGNSEPLPFEIQIGISKRLRHLPFRFSIIYQHFDRWNVLYDDPNNNENSIFFNNQVTERSPTSIWFDNFFRHFIFNGEFLFGQSENFRLRFGYNHLKRKELLVNNSGGLAGFSFGVGFKINRFKIDYGRSTYHLAGGINHLGITTNLRDF